MKLEQQCCSLQQAKRLKELGVKQESVFVWFKSNIGYRIHFCELGEIKFKPTYSAFTVAELGEMLPTNYHTLIDESEQTNNRIYVPCYFDGSPFTFKDLTNGSDFAIEAEARAAMLIHLIETGVVKP